MAITICGSCIEFGSCTMCNTSPGFSFGGTIKAQCGFCDTREPAGQGSTSGYATLGCQPGSPMKVDVEKFSFSSDSPATDVGQLTQGRYDAAGISSTLALYTAGGHPSTDRIDKMPFSSEGAGTDVGNLSVGRVGPSGHMSDVSGYAAGGSSIDTIEKFPFASDGNTTDVGEMLVSGGRGAAITSIESGYRAGGQLPSTPDDSQIEKFPFSSDSNSTDVGELFVGVGAGVAGQNSKTHGYASGGLKGPPYARVSCIQKFPFASDSPASDIASLTINRRAGAGSSSTVSGYTAGGQQWPAICNTIDKFPFASDSSASDVGDLTAGKYGMSGHQV